MRTFHKKGRHTTYKRLEEFLNKNWKSKIMRVQYIRSTERQLICEEDIFIWLLRGDLISRN
jgi:hypothetical protein